MKKIPFLLIVIVFLAVVLRAYQLSAVPPSASLDEVSIGWNAYSILNTGGDGYGYKFPILLRAYDDWRPALYVYFVVPFIKFLGLNVLAVRLPSAIFGTIAVLATYFLVTELFTKYKYKKNLAFLSTFLFAVSPWSVYISRLGHEANAGFAFGIFAIVFFLKFKNSLKNIYIYLSSIFFALSFYAYQSEKIFIPLIALTLGVLFRKKLLQAKLHVIFAALIALAILLPVIKETLSPNGLIRLRGTNAFDITQPIYVNAANERLEAKQNKDLIREILSNNRIISSQIFFENYISHFNPKWLFTNSGKDDFKAPGVGLLYLFELPFILIGLIFLLSRSFDKEVKIFLMIWILISPVAASISTGAPHVMRSYNFLPTFQILSSLGLLYMFSFIKKERTRKLFVLAVAVIVTSSIYYFYKQYFIAFPKEQSSSFQYSLSKAVPYVLQNNTKFNKVVFSNRRNLSQSYMFFLFYSKYDPILYQKEGGTKSGGFEQIHKIGKYEFQIIDLKKISKNVLYLGNPSESPTESDFAVKNFKDLDGNTSVVAFYIK